MKQDKLNPAGIKVGDIVTTQPRKDGIPDRFGDDAKWEVIEVLTYGASTLRLVGGADSDRCGALTRSLTLVTDK